jgi:hypothetical protein
VLHTNSTGILAPLNGTIVVGTDYLYPISEGFTTYWEWVPLPPPLTPTATMEENPPPSPMNTTTTVTEEELQQQQQTTPTIPPSPLIE